MLTHSKMAGDLVTVDYPAVRGQPNAWRERCTGTMRECHVAGLVILRVLTCYSYHPIAPERGREIPPPRQLVAFDLADTVPPDRARRLALTIQVRACFDSDAARALRNKPWRTDPGAVDSAGHCYVACEVIYHALGGPASGLVPVHMRWQGMSHWVLRDRATGDVLDPTADQFHVRPTAADYAQYGRGCGFLTRAPSRRARALAALAGILI